MHTPQPTTTTTTLAINDYRRHDDDDRGHDPGTVYIDAIKVAVRSSFEPLPEAIGNWPVDLPQVRLTLDAGPTLADVQLWLDVPTALELRQEVERALSDPRCRS